MRTIFLNRYDYSKHIYRKYKRSSAYWLLSTLIGIERHPENLQAGSIYCRHTFQLSEWVSRSFTNASNFFLLNLWFIAGKWSFSPSCEAIISAYGYDSILDVAKGRVAMLFVWGSRGFNRSVLRLRLPPEKILLYIFNIYLYYILYIL